MEGKLSGNGDSISKTEHQPEVRNSLKFKPSTSRRKLHKTSGKGISTAETPIAQTHEPKHSLGRPVSKETWMEDKGHSGSPFHCSKPLPGTPCFRTKSELFYLVAKSSAAVLDSTYQPWPINKGCTYCREIRYQALRALQVRLACNRHRCGHVF
jgi:hypothetical protein